MIPPVPEGFLLYNWFLCIRSSLNPFWLRYRLNGFDLSSRMGLPWLNENSFGPIWISRINHSPLHCPMKVNPLVNWEDYIDEIRRAGYGKKKKVPKNKVGELPDRFEPSPLSLKNGAKAVYREDCQEDTVQVREYDDYYTLQLDQYHPKYTPVKHMSKDVPKDILVGWGMVAIGSVALYGMWRS